MLVNDTQEPRDDQVATWRDEGWVLIEGLVPTDEIDAAAADLREIFPTPEEYHADPEGERERWLGRRPRRPEGFVWPEKVPASGPSSTSGRASSRSPGSGALNRLCVHPAIVDFAERALQSTDIRLYQAHTSAKYTGETNYEQPMHTDRNHSWLPAHQRAAVVAPRDVPLPLRRGRRQRADASRAPLATPAAATPTRLRSHAEGRPGAVRGRTARARRSRLAARVPQRRVPPRRRHHRTRRPRASSSALAFKRAGHDWIGYTTAAVEVDVAGLGRVRRRIAHRASSSSSDSRRPVTRSGTRSCSTRRPSGTRNSTSDRGARLG